MKNDSVILIDKPSDMTSFGVVARVRRVLSNQLGRKAKVGHTGTLDPFATGLMLIVTGKECKNAGNYSKLDKVYEATIRLGQASSTGDPEGEITDVSHQQPSLDQVKSTLDKFVGQIKQKPPIYSAIKINGQRAYKLAREGEKVDMPERTVTIHSIELVSYDYPLLKIKTHVGSGTYIRTLAEDIGNSLQTGAYCQELRRTRVGEFDISNATNLSELIEDLR